MSIDIRDAFFDELSSLAASDPDLLLLTDDQGAFGLNRFRRERPSQFLNAGIAEQNLISVAAGLALSGKRPFVYGIATFMSMRCYEQIRVDLGCMQLPVTIVASGPGYSYGSDGPTHHANQDIAILRVLPGLSLYNPSDAVLTVACARLAYATSGPAYIRLERGVLPELHRPDDDFSAGFLVLAPVGEVVLVATGVMVARARTVAEQLGRHGVQASVIDVFRLAPIAAAELVAALGPARAVIALEDSARTGGLGSAVLEILADAGRSCAVMRIAAPDSYLYEYGDRDWLHARVGLDEVASTAAILAWLERTLA